jgi:hypothetical protein
VTDRVNTAPSFQQPFLELIVKGEQARNFFNTPMYLIDVEGKIELYIDDDRSPTPLLIELCDKLAKAGILVTEFKGYEGSAGPHFILRNGVLFHRTMSIEEPSDDVLAYAPRIPKYRGPK